MGEAEHDEAEAGAGVEHDEERRRVEESSAPPALPAALCGSDGAGLMHLPTVAVAEESASPAAYDDGGSSLCAPDVGCHDGGEEGSSSTSSASLSLSDLGAPDDLVPMRRGGGGGGLRSISRENARRRSSDLLSERSAGPRPPPAPREIPLRRKAGCAALALLLGAGAIAALAVPIHRLWNYGEGVSVADRQNSSSDSFEGGGEAPSPVVGGGDGGGVDSAALKSTLAAVSSIEDLNDTASPQGRALRWLLEEDTVLNLSNIPNLANASLVDGDKSWRLLQRYSLAVLYYSTGGTAHWTEGHRSVFLVPDAHECDWSESPVNRRGNESDDENEVEGSSAAEGSFGVHCSNDDDDDHEGNNHNGGDNAGDQGHDRRTAIGLSLDSNNLTGTLPFPELALALPHLRYLHARSNQLLGTLSPVLMRLTSLRSLILRDNDLDGPLPEQIGAATSLLRLDLGRNRLNSTIPSSVGRLTRLRYFDLGRNHLGGSIPEEMGDMSALEYVRLGNNRLTSTIPTSWGMLERLREIHVHGNELTGTGVVPVMISFASAWRNLTVLRAGRNYFRGTLQSELFALIQLTTLSLHNNGYYGTIPSTLSRLTALRFLDLHTNDFTGAIPPSLLAAKSLTLLNLNGNALAGPLPDVIGNRDGIAYIGFERNFLTGTVPSSYGGLPNLMGLTLRSNFLGGAIPVSLGENVECLVLALEENALSGAVPASLGRLEKLVWLSVARNDLTGDLNSVCRSASSRGAKRLVVTADCSPASVAPARMPPVVWGGAEGSNRGGTNVFLQGGEAAAAAEVTCDCCAHCCRDDDDDGCDHHFPGDVYAEECFLEGRCEVETEGS